MSAALNPFYDDEEEEEEEEEDQEVDEEQHVKQSEYLLHLPDPCKTVARERCHSDQYSQKNTNSENSIRYSERLKVKIAGGLVEGKDEINETV